MSLGDWLERADRTLASAKILLDHGDPSGACSSAYYAMFYAARAALFGAGQPERALGKTHSGMIASFHQFLVQPGLVAPQQGRALQHEFSRRLIADYEVAGVDVEAAKLAIDRADVFVAVVRALADDSFSDSSG